MSWRFNGSENLIDRSDKSHDRGQRGADVQRIAYPPSKLRMVRREKVIVIFYCADWRELPEGASRPGNILKQIKPRLTPYYFRHNYVTLLYESGVDPLIAMKIVGHTDYQTTANIYTHVRDEMLKKATVNMNEVFQNRTGD